MLSAQRLLTALLIVTLADAGIEARAGKGVAAAATFGGGAIAGSYAGVLDGTFRADLSRTSQAESVCFGIVFDAVDNALEPVPVVDAGGYCFEATLLVVHGVSSLPETDFGARQVGLSFLDARGYLYALQFGDAYVNPPDYARGTCTAMGASGCIAAALDSSDDVCPGQSGEPRVTGPQARLTVQVGRKKPVTVGIYDVPFLLAIASQQP